MKKIITTYKGLPMHISETICKDLSIAQELFPRGAYVLDVGAGEGASSKRLQDSGYKVDVLEPFYDFSLSGIHNIKLKVGSKNYFRWVNKHKSQYSLIVVIEVIEHLKDLWGFISST